MSDFTTIVAPATPVIPSGICVIRISGNETKNIIEKIFVSSTSPIANPRLAVYGKIVSKKLNEKIDDALCLFFKAPHSYTGEDVAELNVHGNPLIVKKVLSLLYEVGAQPAGPGEFTKRAFLNGKLDLTQAEAVNDVILASADEALKLSRENLEGKFSKAINDIGTPLRDILAELEASIDFPEEDISPSSLNNMKLSLINANKKIGTYIDTFNFGKCVRDGFRVLILGVPNAGKSSLLNKLLNKERAIVTDISGTTRDLIEEHASINGLEYIFCDTAGIRDTESEVEKIGINLAKSKIDWADLILLVVDSNNVNESKELYDILKLQDKNMWIIQNKIDVADCDLKFFNDEKVIKISALNNTNIDKLLSSLESEVKSKYNVSENSIVVTNERHLSCLKRAFNGISSCVDTIDKNLPLEIISSELRIALNALEEIIGKTYTEDILGRIFSKFCIGK